MYLCCDLGGTTCEWGIFDPGTEQFIFNRTLQTSDYEDFYQMLDDILNDYDNRNDSNAIITNATLGIAGPTDYQTVKPTNIEGWEISIDAVNALLKDYGHDGFSSILNDFEALGYGIHYLIERGLSSEDYVEIHGKLKVRRALVEEKRGTRAIVCGPGTGLGIACIVDGLYRDGFPFIFSSEGGHQSLAPETVSQLRLISKDGGFLEPKSYEEVLSHSGIKETYNYFLRNDYSSEPNYNATAKEIVSFSKSGKDHAAIDTIELFTELLANFCGNSVLSFNCDKVVYLWGGVLVEMPEDLLKARFSRHYGNRRAHSGRTKRVPVVLLKNKEIPLLGCASRSNFEISHLKNFE